MTTGDKNARYCYGLTLDRQLMDALDDSFSLEILTREEALSSIRKLDQEGLVHSVWTFKTPAIGGLCNCDQDCMAYRITHERRFFQNMFRAEYVAGVDPQACSGCRVCLRRLRMPVETGSWSRMLQFGRPRIEYICPYGHGTLREDELQISGLENPEWKAHSGDQCQ